VPQAARSPLLETGSYCIQALVATNANLAARGETPAAFGRRCIPAPPHRAEKRAAGTPVADCVAPPSNIPDIAPHRAQTARWGPRSAVVAPLRRGPHGADCAPWGGTSGRLAALGATLDFHHGLLSHLGRRDRKIWLDSGESGRGITLSIPAPEYGRTVENGGRR
jgi:hypothetical protein